MGWTDEKRGENDFKVQTFVTAIVYRELRVKRTAVVEGCMNKKSDMRGTLCVCVCVPYSLAGAHALAGRELRLGACGPGARAQGRRLVCRHAGLCQVSGHNVLDTDTHTRYHEHTLKRTSTYDYAGQSWHPLHSPLLIKGVFPCPWGAWFRGCLKYAL